MHQGVLMSEMPYMNDKRNGVKKSIIHPEIYNLKVHTKMTTVMVLLNGIMNPVS